MFMSFWCLFRRSYTLYIEELKEENIIVVRKNSDPAFTGFAIRRRYNNTFCVLSPGDIFEEREQSVSLLSSSSLSGVELEWIDSKSSGNSKCLGHSQLNPYTWVRLLFSEEHQPTTTRLMLVFISRIYRVALH